MDSIIRLYSKLNSNFATSSAMVNVASGGENTVTNILSRSCATGTYLLCWKVTFRSGCNTGWRKAGASTTSKQFDLDFSYQCQQASNNYSTLNGSVYFIINATTTIYITACQTSGSAVSCQGYYHLFKLK